MDDAPTASSFKQHIIIEYRNEDKFQGSSGEGGASAGRGFPVSSLKGDAEVFVLKYASRTEDD